MTTFEITIIALVTVIMLMVIILVKTAIGGFHDVWQQLDNIEDNILDDLRDIRLADKLGKTSPNVPVPLPCYSPYGICTNPQMDCINCPRRGEGGTLSTTSNKVESTNKD